jgi:hypothetical protein
MRIDGNIPSIFTNPMPSYTVKPLVNGEETVPNYGIKDTIDISQQAKDYTAQMQKAESQKAEIQKADSVDQFQSCHTCENRHYVDKSDDPSVSFQTPTRLSPGQAAPAVMAHEREHISNEQAKAQRNDRKVISQSITISMSQCNECHVMYVSGGTARTVTASSNSSAVSENASEDNSQSPASDE